VERMEWRSPMNCRGIGMVFLNTDTHTHTSTHPYEHMHLHTTAMSTFERLNRLDLEIYKVGHQECLTVDGDITSH
jgi:hypothetical protein